MLGPLPVAPGTLIQTILPGQEATESLLKFSKLEKGCFHASFKVPDHPNVDNVMTRALGTCEK